MSVSITQVIIGSETDRRLTLGNAHWAATMGIGSAWTKLRVGCRVAFDDFGANLTGTPRFYLGLLANPTSGLTNGALTTTTSHFIGMRTNGSPWARTIGASSHYGHANVDLYCKKVGVTVTTGDLLASGFYHSILPASNRTAFVVEFEKLSSISTGVAIVGNIDGNNNTGDLTSDYLKAAMEQADIASVETFLDGITGQNYAGGGGAVSMATDEAADGYWNAIYVGWDRSTPLCYVSDMFFAKVA